MSDLCAAKQARGATVRGFPVGEGPASRRRMVEVGRYCLRREARVQPARPPPMMM